MPNCITCGGEISTNQWNNYEGLCPACIRNENIQESNIHDLFASRSFKKKIKARTSKWDHLGTHTLEESLERRPRIAYI